LHENLTSALDCNAQAGKALIAGAQPHMAGAMGVEMGVELGKLARLDEAIEHLERGASPLL
jgi:hypothetical protein